jgi:hypothetical protein
MKEVFISDNVDVVLVAAAANENLLKIDKSVSLDYTVYSSESALHIFGPKRNSMKNNTIYLTGGQLSRLTIEGSVNLKTHGTLSTGKIDLYVGGDSKAQLKTKGKVKVHAFDDSEVRYQVRDLSKNTLITKRA